MAENLIYYTVKAVIDARDKGIHSLRREYQSYKGKLYQEVSDALKPVVKNREIPVYSQQKWNLRQDFQQYIKNHPFRPMPFHNQSVTITKNDKGFFQITFLVHRENKENGQHPTCILRVPKKYAKLLETACGENNPVLGEVRITEDKKYGRFNVHLTLRLPKPEPYTPKGWIGVDIGWNSLATSVYVNSDGKATDVTFHAKDYKTRIIRLRHLLKIRQRHGKAWKARLRNTTNCAVGIIAKEIVEKALKHKAGIRLERLSFKSFTKRYLIPRSKLQHAIKTLAERKSIPIQFVSARYSSLRCNKCGEIGNRDGKDFQCKNCGYEAHADVNAAINIGCGNPLGYTLNGKAAHARGVLVRGNLQAP